LIPNHLVGRADPKASIEKVLLFGGERWKDEDPIGPTILLNIIQLHTIVQSAPRISTRPLLILPKIILLASTTTAMTDIPRPPLLLVH
jgi:hypothetical protein